MREWKKKNILRRERVSVCVCECALAMSIFVGEDFLAVDLIQGFIAQLNLQLKMPIFIFLNFCLLLADYPGILKFFYVEDKNNLFFFLLKNIAWV